MFPDFDPVTTPIDALMSYNYNPCLITMAGSNQATGPEHSPDTDNRKYFSYSTTYSKLSSVNEESDSVNLKLKNSVFVLDSL